MSGVANAGGEELRAVGNHTAPHHTAHLPRTARRCRTSHTYTLYTRASTQSPLPTQFMYAHVSISHSDTVDRIFAGLASSGLYKGSLLPVLTTDMPLREALARLGRLDSAILPSSLRKIAQCKVTLWQEARAGMGCDVQGRKGS